MILNEENKEQAREIFSRILDMGVGFKLQNNVAKKQLTSEAVERILVDLPEDGASIEDVLNEFEEHILPYCTNFSSKKFLGFPDAGNSVGALGGGVLSNFGIANLK